MTLLTIAPWLLTMFTALVGALAYLFKHQTTKAQIATVQSDASARVMAANADRDAALTAIAETRDAISQSNENAAQKGLDATQERTNVEAETRAATRADNVRWMQEHNLIRPAESSGSASPGVSTGEDHHPASATPGSSRSNQGG